MPSDCVFHIITGAAHGTRNAEPLSYTPARKNSLICFKFLSTKQNPCEKLRRLQNNYPVSWLERAVLPDVEMRFPKSSMGCFFLYALGTKLLSINNSI